MKRKSQSADVLHCGPPFYRGPQRRERKPIEITTLPVAGKTTLFSLQHACLAAGMLEDIRKRKSVDSINCDANSWLDWVNQKWQRSIDNFFADAASLGVTKETVNNKASELQGAIIGWKPWVKFCRCICPDLNLTLAILSRRINDIFISYREPDYSWDNLFGQYFEIDDNRILAPDLESEPWSKFKWFGRMVG